MKKGHLLCLLKAMEPTHETRFPIVRCVLLSGTEAELAERGILVCAGYVLRPMVWKKIPTPCSVELTHFAKSLAPASVPT